MSVIWVPFGAMSLPKLPCRSDGCAIPAPGILAVGDRLEMLRIHAGSIAAQMVNMEAIRDLSLEEFMRQTVSGVGHAMCAYKAISSAV